MFMSTVIDAIRENFPCRVDERGADRPLSYFIFLSPEIQTLNEDCLYVQRKGEAGAVCEGMALLSFDPDSECPPGGSLIYLNERYFTECMNLLTGRFFEEQEREESFRRLVSAPSGSCSLQELIDKAASFMDRSLVLINLSFHIIAASQSVPVTDEIWRKNTARGYCTYEFISAVNQLLPDSSGTGTEEPFFVNCRESRENKLCACIRFDGRTVGYLILLDNEKGVLPYHMQYLTQTGQLISSALQRSSEDQSLFVNMTEKYIRDLLEGDRDPTVRDELLRMNIKLPNRMRCLVFYLRNRSLYDKFYLQRELRKIFPLGVIPILDGELAAVVSDQAYPRIYDAAYGDLFKVADKIGVSLAFRDISELPQQFRYAKAACEFSRYAEPAGRICRYEDIQLLHIFRTCEDTALLKDYVHPALETLHVYDLAHGTRLFDTLYQYIHSGMSVKKTSEAMFLHRNTLNYRLNRIRELTGTDFTDMTVSFHLFASFEINKLLNLY